MEPSVHFTDLPKPFWQHLLRKLDPDPHTKHSLRASSREIATLIDEQADLSCCLQGEHLGLETLLLIAKLSSGITTLLLPELRLFQAPHLSVTFPPGAFARLQHLCLNYRLSNLCQALAAAAGPSLTSVAIVPGRRKGSHWQAKLCRFLQVLQQLQQLQCLRMTLHCTQASAGLVGQLQQLHALQLAIDKTPGDSTPHPEHLFDAELWKLAIAPLTALTELSLSLPLLLSHATAAQLVIPSGLQQLRLHLQHSDVEQQAAEQPLTGLAAGQLLLGSLPALPQLTQLVLKAVSPNDWFAGPDVQLSSMAASSLGQLTNLCSLKLLVGHWQLSLLQLQPLSACVHLTELVLSELVMGYSGEGQDDQLGSRLTPEEAAAVAAGVAAAAAGAEQMRRRLQEQQQQGSSAQQNHEQQLQQQQLQDDDEDEELWQLLSPRAGAGNNNRSPSRSSRPSSSCSFAGCEGARRSSCGGGSSGGGLAGLVVPQTMMRVEGSSVKVPLLPQLQVLRCTTLWWRLPLVVLAPCLAEVAYKRLRNLGYGSFVLPDLQDWEDEQLPPVFEGLLQQGNAAGAAAGGGGGAAGGNAAAAGGAVDDPLGGLLGAILAPQGGFHANNQHGHHNNNNNNNNNDVDDVNAAAAGGADAAAAAAAADADDVLDQLLQELQQHQQEQQLEQQGLQQQQQEGPAAAWQAINPWQPVDWGIVPNIPPVGQPAAALPVGLPAQLAGQQQQQQPAGGSPAAAAAASDQQQAPQLADAAIPRAYGDVLRGQRCLRSLDVCVTALCKVMRSSSSALGQLQQLRLHMLGEVRLAGGGLPWLPHLSWLEFYLPDERNWDADYNDDEDIALWQNQRSVTHITVRGTFHAGGFFAPGHLDRARVAMPRLRCVLFANCGDLHSDRLQQVIDARLAPLIVLQACGADSSAAGKAAAAAAAAGTSAGGPATAAAAAGVPEAGGDAAAAASSAAAAAADWLEGDVGPQVDGFAAAEGGAGSSSSSSSGGSGVQHMEEDPFSQDADLAAAETEAAAAAAADGAAASSAPQLVSEAVVRRMAAGAAAAGVTLQWVGAVQPWKAWLDEEAGWQ
uniref:Uncharacterized protein n=1 Tax=Tetradesmus obliquus TaxID=3088 RepID=A0A383VC31_TETOB|eukprot:jgi/Sobl393_1/9047/SZX62493.1